MSSIKTNSTLGRAAGRGCGGRRRCPDGIANAAVTADVSSRPNARLEILRGTARAYLNSTPVLQKLRRSEACEVDFKLSLPRFGGHLLSRTMRGEGAPYGEATTAGVFGGV